jgi:3-dehydroquinate synthase
MDKPTTIQTSHYEILLGENAISQLSAFLKNHSYSKLFVLMDENTYKKCYPPLLLATAELSDAELMVIDPGEENKSIEVATQLWRSLNEHEADRHSLLINLGGGIITDLGGFVASCFKRGMDFINIPTSLLAMVDASVGGKTGLNLDHFKNQIGLFSTPKQIIIDPLFLETLPQNQLLSAYAEMLKHGLIADKKYWDDLCKVTQLNPSQLQAFIENSIQIKKRVVEEDPTEKGLRKILNFGHSIGHAIESYYLTTENEFTHGESVALGMLAETYLSVKILNLDSSELEQIERLIRQHYSFTPIREDHLEEISALIMHDKKKEGNRLNFSLLKKIGQAEIDIQVTPNEILNALKYLIHGHYN